MHLISVIIPYYKGERFIAETLNSVFRQQYPNLEIIIVNDGSPVDSLVALEPFRDRIVLVSQENKGQASARNTGITYAHGDLIAFLDQDDIWTDNHLALLLPYVIGESSFAFAQGKIQEFRTDQEGHIHADEPKLHPVMIGSSLFTSKTIHTVGMFDESMREGEDFDWTVRLQETGLVGNIIPDVTFLYRRHETNYSNTPDFVQKGEFLTIRKKLERLKRDRQENN